jgi:hypothetical protein
MTAALLCNELESLPTATVIAAFRELLKQLSGGTEEVKDKSLSTPQVEVERSKFQMRSRNNNPATAGSGTNLLFH